MSMRWLGQSNRLEVALSAASVLDGDANRIVDGITKPTMEQQNSHRRMLIVTRCKGL